MIRWLIIVIAVFALFIFLASLGGGLGYASAGGEVRIFSKWSEAHSDSGQAIAVVGDDNHLNANNTPTPVKPQTRNSPTDMLLGGFFLVALAILGLWLWSNGFFSSYAGGDIGGHSSSSNYKSTRRYGPD